MPLVPIVLNSTTILDFNSLAITGGISLSISVSLPQKGKPAVKERN